MPSRNAVATTSSYQDQSPRVLGTCIDFNNGFCGRANCKFRHICSNCQAPKYGQVTCFRFTGSSPSQKRKRGVPKAGEPTGVDDAMIATLLQSAFTCKLEIESKSQVIGKKLVNGGLKPTEFT